MEKFLINYENKLPKNDSKVIYNEEQLDFIKNVLEDCKLLGIPGGGKTQSIIGKIIHHNSLNILQSTNEFLILTFSRRACRDFIEKGKRQNKKLFTTKNIRTLHSIAGKIVNEVLEKRSSSQDTVIISAIDMIDKNREKVLEIDDFNNLKVIFVDEAQDISEIQYLLILKIKEITHCHVIMIGDPNQNIYQFQKGSDKFLINHPGPTFSLIKNYRSTPHIVNFINQFRPWDAITPKMVSTKEESDIFNKKPSIFIHTIEKIIENVVEKILRSPFKREEIAIIGPVKKSKPTNDTYTNIGLSLFTNLLNKYNILFIKHYEDTNTEEQNYKDIKKKEDHINILTIHGSKGLEFKQVFLLNFHITTFGMMPTEEKYKEFKYLWYVGLSRASHDLHIYIDKNKTPWNELKNCLPEYYIKEESNPLRFIKELKFQEEIIPVYYTVTELLGSKKYFDDKLLYELQNLFEYEVETINIRKENNSKKYGAIENYTEYAALYGMFIENIFNYYYHIKRNKISDFITRLVKIINNTIIIPKEHITGYKILKIRCPFILKNVVKLSDFNTIKNYFQKQEEELFSYLCNLLQNNYNHEFFIDCENDVTYYSKDFLLKCIENLDQNKGKYQDLNQAEQIESIFKITLFYYQKTNETAYLWKYDFAQELEDLNPYIEDVIEYALQIEEEYKFHPTYKHPKLPIVGELDMLSENKNQKKIIDIKFSSQLNLKHVLQVMLYYHIIEPNMRKEYDVELWNFHLGKIYRIKPKIDNIDIYRLLKILSIATKKKLENMIFFYDLETTGFAYKGKKVDIIERYFEEYTTSIVPSRGLLKPEEIPFIPFEITALTGITMEMVNERGDSMQHFRNDIDILLNYCNKPFFIAHNGNSFDHKILLSKEILKMEKCNFLDSRMIIRLFLEHPVSEKSLSDIFKHLFRFLPVVHRAESDVHMLIEIFRKLEITEEKIVNMI
jgi:DNA polymerase III epsilon subunit-like protein